MTEPARLPDLLAEFPGIAVEIDEDDRIVSANDAARDCFGGEADFRSVLDRASLEKWKRIRDDGTRPVTAELLIESTLEAGPRTFFIGPRRNERRVLIEIPSDPETSRLHEELTALNSDLVNAQREITKQRAELQRSVSEKTKLSQELQAHGEELEAQNEELLAVMEELRLQQEESARLNRQLEEQTEELRRVIRSRERFFSAMSHELRTPLTGILGYGHLLLDGIAGELTEQQRQFVERTRAAAQHLNSVLDDILDLAKLESGTLELTLEQTIIADLVQDVVSTIRPSAEAAGCPLRIRLEHAPDFITVDARALRQILLNLMSNAIKFGAGQPVTLMCTRDGDRVRFEVSDLGVGVEPEAAQEIFEEFGQAEAGRQKKGTGLGLSISRQLAERMGGNLRLRPDEGPGATFVVDLPVAGPADP